MPKTTTSTFLLTAALGASLLSAACGGGNNREDLARLEAENAALAARLQEAELVARDQNPAAAASLKAPEGAKDDWSWADEPLKPGDQKPGASTPEANKPVVVEPAPRPATPPAPKPAAPKPAAPKPPAQPTNRFETPPEPAPTPAPKPVIRTANAGSSLQVTTKGELSSATAELGDRVEMTLSRDLLDSDGRLVLPAGTLLSGRVSEVQAARKVKKKSLLAFQLNKATLPDGRTADIAAGMSVEGEGYTKKEGAIIGGSAAGGALLGQVLGKDSEATAAGAVIGGAIGSGVVLSKRGPDVTIPSGTLMDLTLQDQVRVETPGA